MQNGVKLFASTKEIELSVAPMTGEFRKTRIVPLLFARELGFENVCEMPERLFLYTKKGKNGTKDQPVFLDQLGHFVLARRNGDGIANEYGSERDFSKPVALGFDGLPSLRDLLGANGQRRKK